VAAAPHPPERVLRNEQRLGARVIHRAAEQLAAHLNSERVALAIAAALQGPELSALQELLSRAQNRASDVLMAMHVPHLPSREEILSEARTMFSRTPSLEEIVDRAYDLFIASVGSRLVLNGDDGRSDRT
jgi:stearoyl-CoA desaturase (Delta-9 desaturase)